MLLPSYVRLLILCLLQDLFIRQHQPTCSGYRKDPTVKKASSDEKQGGDSALIERLIGRLNVKSEASNKANACFSRNKRSSIHRIGFYVFRSGWKVTRWLSIWDSPYSDVWKEAKLLSANGKTWIYEKPGSYETALADFRKLKPYGVQHLPVQKRLTGMQGKIRGYADETDIDLRNTNNKFNPEEYEFGSFELRVVVRSWSSKPPSYPPTLDIYPSDRKRRRRFSLKMRYEQ